MILGEGSKDPDGCMQMIPQPSFWQNAYGVSGLSRCKSCKWANVYDIKDVERCWMIVVGSVVRNRGITNSDDDRMYRSYILNIVI